MTTTIAMFPSYSTAQAAVEALQAQGIANEYIGIIAPEVPSDQAHAPAATLESVPAPAQHQRTNIGVGTTIGAIGGLVLGGLLVPGLGWIAVAGSIATAVAGAGLGTLTGGMVSTMEQFGVPKDQSLRITEALQKRYTVVLIQSDTGTNATVRSLLKDHAAEIVDQRTGTEVEVS